MSGGGRLAKHTGIFMIMELGIRIMDALVSMILARYLHPHGFGLLAFATSFSSLFSVLPGFGMGSLSTRDVSQQPDQLNRYVSNGLIAKLFLAGLTLVLLGIVARFAGFVPEKATAVMLAGVLMIVETNFSYLLSFFQAAHRVATVAIMQLAVRAGWVVSSVLVILVGGGVPALLATRIAITAVGLITAVVLIHRQLQRLTWTYEARFIVRMLRQSFPFALFRLYGTVYMDIDTLMLNTMRGDVMTGWYAAAQKFLRVLTFIPNSFSAAMLPILSGAPREAFEQRRRTIARAAKYLLAISIPIACGATVLARPIVLLLYGHAYEGTVRALQILIWTLPFSFLNGALIVSIAAVNLEREGSRCLMMGALFSGLSNLVVIPMFGHLGAAATTLLAEVSICAMQLRVLRKALPGARLAPGWSRIVAAGGVMSLAVWGIRSVPLAVAVPSGAAAYALLLRGLGVFEPNEWKRLMKSLLKKQD